VVVLLVNDFLVMCDASQGTKPRREAVAVGLVGLVRKEKRSASVFTRPQSNLGHKITQWAMEKFRRYKKFSAHA
jgi:hypothetical protein